MGQRVCDKSLEELMIEAQAADKIVRDAIRSKEPEEVYKPLLKDLGLKTKRVQRRFNSIRSGRIRWFDGKDGYVRPEGALFLSAEVLHSFVPAALLKDGTRIKASFEYWGPYAPVQCIIEEVDHD